MVGHINLRDGEALPLLLGDLAITVGRRILGFRERIPTVGSALGPHGKVRGRYLAGFTQKLCVLSPRLAIGWAGSPVAARMVLDAARQRYGSTGVDWREMAELLKQLDFCDGKIGGLDLSIIGLSLLHAQRVEMFGFGCNEMIRNHTEFGDLYASGTGTPYILRTIPEASSAVRGTTHENLHPLHRAISRTLMWTIRSFVGEILYAESLKEFFGGGFEIAFSLGSSIQKIGEVTYTFWFIKGVDRRKLHLSRPALILKFSYHGSLLIIRRLVVGTSKLN